MGFVRDGRTGAPGLSGGVAPLRTAAATGGAERSINRTRTGPVGREAILRSLQRSAPPPCAESG
jgi:hypothetical protein